MGGIVVNPSVLSKGIRSEFISALATTPSLVPRLATVVQSNKDSEDYAWLGDVPQMKEFVDERISKSITDTKYSITNKTWEATLGVKRSALEDDQVGGLPIRIRDLAARARNHATELLYQALMDGTNATKGKCYDGGAFFSATHPTRGEQTVTQSNLLTGTGVTVAAIKADVQTAIQKFLEIKDERNKPFHPSGVEASQLIAIVPPALLFAFREALNAAIISNTSNMLVGAVSDVIPGPYLSDTNDWYLLHVGNVIKPLIFQDRVSIELESMEGMSDAGFMRETYLYGVRARYNAGYGLWQDAFKVTN